jgi:NAD(P)-dependent dehydrogenase (short-subunit alcohol dehydrogenase family)
MKEEMAMRFKDKVVLITAAASGIGRATAEIMGREGGIVIAVDNNAARLDATVGAILDAGGQAHAYPADALDEGQVNGLVTEVAARLGRIDVLVNAVGGSTIIADPAATMEQLSLADWQALLHFNLTGTFLFTHAVIPVMRRNGGGKIVNLASIAGRGLSEASSAAYATAKGGIVALTKKLSIELGQHGITVNAIAPATTLTERIRPRWEQQPPEDRARDVARTPLRRMGVAEDQAKVICFLASADADFVTGLTIDVTGGL